MKAAIELYASWACPYCWQAKRILQDEGVPFQEKPIWMIFGVKLPTRNYREMVRRANGNTTVPQIFVNGHYYGDEDTLKRDRAEGRLKERLEKTG